MAVMLKHSEHSNKCEWHTAPQQRLELCLISLMVIKKGYQNVRVSQGKPLTSGNTARFLLPVYNAAVA